MAILWSLPFGILSARIAANRARHLTTATLCILLIATLFACTATDEDSTNDERLLELETTVQSLQESLQATQNENTELNREIATLRQKLEDLEAKSQANFSDKEQWSKGDKASLPEGAALERTAQLAEDAGGEVHYIEHPERGDRTVLVTPQDFVNGETPLIVSLHGYGGNSADHSAYFPIHERVNSHGFAILLPTGSLDAQGNPFWNPTDHCCDGGKSGEDDVAYLTDLVTEAMSLKDFGPIYFFGYSNGGFMAHHMACKGLPRSPRRRKPRRHQLRRRLQLRRRTTCFRATNPRNRRRSDPLRRRRNRAR